MNLKEIKIGMRVAPNKTHHDYERFEHQHEGFHGVVTDIDRHGMPYNVKVKWDNGQECWYDALMLLDETKIGEEKERTHLYYVGLKVRPNPADPYYEGYKMQHHDEEGEIVGYSPSLSAGDHNVRVKWASGHTNGYPESMLIPIDEQIEKQEDIEIVTEEDVRYAFPILAGTRVCLDPECEEHITFKRRGYKETGYVLSENIAEDVYKNWRKYKTDVKKNISVTVFFDDSRKLTIKVSKLLEISAPKKDIEKYVIKDWGVFYVTSDEERENLDKLIIRDRYKIEAVIRYDNEYRERVRKLIEKK